MVFEGRNPSDTYYVLRLFLRAVFAITSYMVGIFVFSSIIGKIVLEENLLDEKEECGFSCLGQVGNVITNRNASRLEFERLLVWIPSIETISKTQICFSLTFRIVLNNTCARIMFLQKCNDASNVGMIIPGHVVECPVLEMCIQSNYYPTN